MATDLRDRTSEVFIPGVAPQGHETFHLPITLICRPGFSHRSTSDSQVLVNRYLGGLVDCSRVLETAWPPEPSPLCHASEVGAAPNELSTTTMGYFRRAGPDHFWRVPKPNGAMGSHVEAPRMERESQPFDLNIPHPYLLVKNFQSLIRVR